MAFLQQLRTWKQKRDKEAQRKHDAREHAALVKAKKELSRATTQHQKDMARLKLRQDRANLDRELANEKIATQKAIEQARVAREQAYGPSFGGRLAKGAGVLARSAAKSPMLRQMGRGLRNLGGGMVYGDTPRRRKRTRR